MGTSASELKSAKQKMMQHISVTTAVGFGLGLCSSGELEELGVSGSGSGSVTGWVSGWVMEWALLFPCVENPLVSLSVRSGVVSIASLVAVIWFVP